MAHLKPLTAAPPAVLTSSEDGWLIVSGEIDLVTAPQLAVALATRDYAGVDLAAVTFMDVSGLRVLLEAGRRAEAAGRRLLVTRASTQIRRLFELTAIDQTLELIDDHSSAITSL